MKKARILTIDDESMVTQAVKRLLGPRYDVVGIDDARLAYDLLTTGERFDVIVCDVSMPLMNGMCFYNKVKELDAAQAARIVFLTGGGNQPQIHDFLQSIPNRCLDKPFVPRALEALIEELTPVLN